MNTRLLITSARVIAIVAATSSIVGCSLVAGYLREHHFKEDESTALILDAKERVITQRKVEVNPKFEDRINPGIIVCAEPSPDVANALSSAISTSLNAALPAAAGAKNVSADLSLSRAESIVQLGSRIATIQLLRDELADLCRSYANGAVTATTYTLRLSRLDKKMVTLLLSEAAGRPAGAQAVILGDAAAGTKPAATAEEVTQARQAVVDAVSELSKKDQELKEATDEDRKAKQTARDAAFKSLQDKQTLLLAMERRLLNTSSGASVQTVLLNNTPGNGPQETLAALQENFLLQDDLTTFLDACISSLDLLKALSSEDEKALGQKRKELEDSRTAMIEADVKKQNAADNLERASASQRADAEKLAASTSEELRKRMAEEYIAKERFQNALSDIKPVSRFGEYCQAGALDRLIDANVRRIGDRRELLVQRRLLVEAQARDSKLRACEAAFRNPGTMDVSTREACAAALSREATSPVTPVADQVSLREAPRPVTR